MNYCGASGPVNYCGVLFLDLSHKEEAETEYKVGLKTVPHLSHFQISNLVFTEFSGMST